MRKGLIAFFLGVCFLHSTSYAQGVKAVSLVQGGYDRAQFTVSVPMPTVSTREARGTVYAVLDMEGATHLFRNGEPDLPVLSQIVEVPLCDDIEVSVSQVHTTSLQLAQPLMPMQPAPSKDEKRNSRTFAYDSAIYATDGFYAAPELAWVEEVGIARDRRLAALRVSPVSYNPVTGVVELVTSLEVTLTYKGVREAATRRLHERYWSAAFTTGNDVIATLPQGKSVANAAPIHYLIVAHSSFRGALDSFIDWKRRLGLLVTAAYTDDPAVGTTSTSIAAYIKSFYTNASEELPAPTYLLIVGDHDQIPAFNARCTTPANDHITDLYYVTWDGDNVPDCYRGRFSARTLAELTPQVEKSLLYEGYLFNDPSYLSRGVLIAGEDYGSQGDNAYTYADPTMDYVAKTYVNASNGYNEVYYYKNNTSFAPAGVTVTGSSQSASTETALRNLYNTGCGWVNYSAHGSDDSWSTPGFTTSNVAQMSNSGKPGVFIGNCCLSGHFNTANCLGEALLRRGNNAGAVAYIGATNSTYWPHDFCWTVGVRSNISGTMNTSYTASNLGMYDRLFHTHNEAFSQWHNSLGAMVTAGNMAVANYGSYQQYYWEIYQLFGDPSIKPWLGQAVDMPFNGSTELTTGNANYTFTTAPYAYAALTTGNDHTLVAAAFADASGQVTLSFSSSLIPGTYELALTAQGYKPRFLEVTTIVAEGPYLMVLSVEPQADGNHRLCPGQTTPFSATVVNKGLATAVNSTIGATTTAPGVVSLLPPRILPTIPAGDTVVIPLAFSLYVPGSYAYGDVIRTEVSTTFDGRNSSRSINVPVSSAKLVVSGVGSTTIAAGATVTVSCTVTNAGNIPTADLTFTLANHFGMVAGAIQPVHTGVLQPDQSVQLSFELTMNTELAESPVPVILTATSSEGVFMEEHLTLKGPGSAIETFETGSFSLPWQQGNNAWIITTAEHHSGSYSARSTNNLASRRKSELSLPWTSLSDDSISFWYIVSSEADYDFFTFSIDGAVQLEVSGTDYTQWRRAAFPVPAGSHVFLFKYEKDFSSTQGSDCAWIDDITPPYAAAPSHFVYDTVCLNTAYSFGGNNIATDQLGDYTYTYNDGNETTYLALNVADAPEVTITTSGSSIWGGNTVLTAHGASTYRWSTGETTPSIVVSPRENTSYSVTGYRGGCSDEASIALTVGIAPVQDEHSVQLSVYPNPTRDMLTVVCADARRVVLLNMLGQVVLTGNADATTQQLSLRNLPEGLYMLKVETPYGTAVRKVVKK